ncbi:porin family protein [soil metagenome]
MKKIILLSMAIFCLGAAKIQAQDIQYGIRAGVNNAWWGGNAANYFQELVSFENAFKMRNNSGIQLGGYMNLPITERFSIEPALMYSKKGQQVYQTLFEKSIINPKVVFSSNSHYIDLPVIMKYEVHNGLYVFGGPQISYLLGNTLRAEAGILGFDVLNQRIKYDGTFRKVDAGMTAGVGYNFGNGFNISAGYDHGFTSLDRWGSTDISNRVIRTSIGYTFK